MRTLSTECIILGSKNYGEKHKLMFLYCKNMGKFKAIAKGARQINSRMSGHLETLNIVKTSLYFGPKNIIITEIIPLQNHRTYDQSFEKIHCTLKIAEITNRVIFENQPIAGVYTLIKNALHHLQQTKKPDLILQCYTIKLLDKNGMLPNFFDIKTQISEKYLKFLEFAKEKSFIDLENITLKTDEKKYLENLLKRLIEV